MLRNTEGNLKNKPNFWIKSVISVVKKQSQFGVDLLTGGEDGFEIAFNPGPVED